MIECSGVAVLASESWVALCPEYDIAADGRTFTEALSRLLGMIESAVSVAQEHNLAIGRPVPPEAWQEFMAAHIGEHRPVRRRWRINTDTLEAEILETELVR